eukprot:CAMPEP_0202415062 /NCGR_PEP_ID=MMETSP1128-20130828/34898_1 /ASSEMBLY_ACC=CAM_ASM_000463 /TAXON_ID=3047 /ORGANISM="Dunaliella tertiolecta, Strain CCMP1320" /LENGTH=77 /DNA_ID=CAMNT_0049021643 /DNA_START=426 /DNA_END=659 /DNA_ORIENTATION=-
MDATAAIVHTTMVLPLFNPFVCSMKPLEVRDTLPSSPASAHAQLTRRAKINPVRQHAADNPKHAPLSSPHNTASFAA